MPLTYKNAEEITEQADNLRQKSKYREAVALYLKAAEDGYAQAQCNLGYCYLNGLGCNRDSSKAMEWYTRAAEQGNEYAQYSLGCCYQYGQGCGKDLHKSVEWYTRAAINGNVFAQFILGDCHENGLGCIQDTDKAVEWYTKAAEQGFSPAIRRLDDLKVAWEGPSESAAVSEAIPAETGASEKKRTLHTEETRGTEESFPVDSPDFQNADGVRDLKTPFSQSRIKLFRKNNFTALQDSGMVNEGRSSRESTTEEPFGSSGLADAGEMSLNGSEATKETKKDKSADSLKLESSSAADNGKDDKTTGRMTKALTENITLKKGRENKSNQQSEKEQEHRETEESVSSRISSVRIHLNNFLCSSGRWIKTLAVWLFILLLTGIVAGCVLWSYAEAYEKSRPEPAVEEILAIWSEEDLITAAASNNTFQISEFEDGDQLYADYIRSRNLTGSLRYQKELEQPASDTLVFSILDGTARICNVVLEADENLNFQLNTWKFSYVTTPDVSKILDSTKVRIISHEGLPVYINEKQATTKNCKTWEESFKDLNPIEQKQPEEPVALVYCLESVYGEIRVEDGAKNEILPSEENGEYVYDMVAPQNYAVNIYTPDDIRIQINDYELTEEDLAGIDYTVAEKLENCTDISSYGRASYSFRQFHNPPAVTAYDKNGTKLKPITTEDGSLNYYTNDPELESTLYDVVWNFFDLYTEYCSHRYNDTNYLRLKRYTMTDSPLHQYIAQTYDTMIWATGTETIYKELIISNFRLLNGSCFRCTVQYSADILSKDSQTEDLLDTKNALELIFVQKDGKWLAANMTAI